MLEARRCITVMFLCRKPWGLSLAVAMLMVFGCGRRGLSVVKHPDAGADGRPWFMDAVADQGREDAELGSGGDSPQDFPADGNTQGDAANQDAGSDDSGEAGARDTQRAIDTVSVLSLLAGDIGGAGSLNGTGPAARFCLPTGMATDGAGNLFVADHSSHVIRKVVLATGEVTTVAGLPTHQGAADGLGADARFSLPQGLASDGAGHLFVADQGNHAVRRIDLATGRVTTLAGSADQPGTADGVGVAASFRSPVGVAADGAGFVYVSDQDSHTIRRISLADGQVTTVAGQANSQGDSDGVASAARFNSPEGIAVDGNGKLFVVDLGNARIREIALATAQVTTLESGSLSGPVGIVSDRQGRLYVSDRYDMVLWAVDTASGTASLLAGKQDEVGYRDGTGSAALFNSPWGMALDDKGNLLVADSSNHVLRQIAIASGAVTTLAGRAAQIGSADGLGERARFSSASGIVGDGQGNLFAVDRGNHVVRKVVIASGQVTTFAGSPGRPGASDGVGVAASFSRPEGITSDGQGNLFVTDTGNNTLRRIVVATAEVTTFAGAPGVNGSDDGVGKDARFSAPWGVAADDAGNLFVSDSGATIRTIVTSTRAVTTLAGLAWTIGQADGVASRARFSSPRGVAWDAGVLFVADGENYTIRRVSTSDGTVTTVAGSAGVWGSTDGTGSQARFGSLAELTVDQAGHLFIVDNYTIRCLTLSTGAVTTIVGSPDGFGVRLGPLPGSMGGPSGLAFMEPGTLFITDWDAILRADF